MIFRGETLALALRTADRETLRYWLIANTFTADSEGKFTLAEFLDHFKRITGQTLQKSLLKSRLKTPFFKHLAGEHYKSVGRKLLGCRRSTWKHELTLEDLSSKGKFTEFCTRAAALRDRFTPYTKIAATTGIAPSHAKRLINQAVKARKLKKTNNHVIISTGTLDQIHCYRQYLMAKGIVTLAPERTPSGNYILKSYHANVYAPETTVRVTLPVRKDCWIKPYSFKPYGRTTPYRKALTWSFTDDDTWKKWNVRRGI